MLKSSVAVNFIKTIEITADIFNKKFKVFSKDNSKNFEEKLKFVKSLTQENVEKLSTEKREFLAQVLIGIMYSIDSKFFNYKGRISGHPSHIDGLMAYLNGFIDQTKNLYIRYNEEENRVLMHYSVIVTYSSDWNNLTRISRGIIVDLDTYEVVVHPYDKFFNYLEKQETQPEYIPDTPYEVAEKLDGSEGILYPIKNQDSVKVITKGGFSTEQGEFATRLLWDKYPDQARKIIKERIYKDFTITFEILYAEDDPNRIVVAYDEADLRIIGVRDLKTGEALSYSQVVSIAQYLGFPSTNVYDLSLEEILELREKRENFEGWVVRFDNGLYMKIKCAAYLDAHGARFGSSIKYVFNLLKDEKWDDFISSLKVEHRILPEALHKRLVTFAAYYSKQIYDAYNDIPKFESQKEFALYVQKNVEKDLMSYMFKIRNGTEINIFDNLWSSFKKKFEKWENEKNE